MTINQEIARMTRRSKERVTRPRLLTIKEVTHVVRKWPITIHATLALRQRRHPGGCKCLMKGKMLLVESTFIKRETAVECLVIGDRDA